MRGVSWSAVTIKKALRLRFTCGSTGYKTLLQQNHPLPSERTLQRRLENIDFKPGVLKDVFAKLKIKVDAMKDEERLCCLTLDEMSLTSKLEYDAGSDSVYGNVTLPKHSGIATHALVFMLGGITTRWKQTVAYYYTSNSTDGTVFKDIILDIIKRATDIGLQVEAVASDMGSSNRAMWRSFGIVCGPLCQTVNRIMHPQDPERYLYFLADVPHVFKNIKAALVNGQHFRLDERMVREQDLPTDDISIEAVKDLANYQEHLDLKLAPKLKQSNLNPCHFDKMKVSNATNVISHEVSSGIKYLVNTEERPDTNLTTAWFLKMLRKWFDLMTSRHPVMAISKLNIDKYEETIAFLRMVIRVFKRVKIGTKSHWKPFQTGVILSTTSIIQIAEELLDAGHRYLLTSRLDQDCLENLFSVVCLRKPIPSPLEFKFALKLITTAQYLTHTTNSYQQDEGELIAEFLQPMPSNTSDETDEIPPRIEITNQPSNKINQAEMDSLFHLAGYCVQSVKKNCKICERCIKDIEDINQTANDTLTQMREYKQGCLVRVSRPTFQMFLSTEKMFRSVETCLSGTKNVKQYLLAKAEDINKDVQISACHCNIKQKLLTKFITARLHFYCKKVSATVKQSGELGSKSAGMRKLAKKVH